MQRVSDRFIRAVQGGAKVVTRAYISRFGFDGRREIPVYDGTVKVNADATVVRTLESLRVDVTSFLPLRDGGELSTFGSQVRVERGFRYSDGTEELVPIGTFLVEEIDDSSMPIQQVTLKGRDLSAVISNNRWEDLYDLSGKDVTLNVQQAIESRAPGRFKKSVIRNDTIIQAWVFGEDTDNDPWADLVEFASHYGLNLYMSPVGSVVLEGKRSSFFSGSFYGFEFTQEHRLTGYQHIVNTDRVFNRVVVVGEPPEGDAVRSTAEDSDETSPTYVGGPFGVKQRFFSSNLIYTTSQAQKTAQSMLVEALEREHVLKWNGFVNPALEPWDIVRVEVPGLYELPSDRFMVTEFTIPCGEGLVTDYTGQCLRAA